MVECSSCDYYRFCLGGCPYNAISVDDGRMELDGVDHQCEAYKMIFDEMKRRVNRDFMVHGIEGGDEKARIIDLMLKKL